MPGKTEVFSEKHRFFMPEVRIERREFLHRYVPLRGFAYALAVFSEGECIGYVMSDTLGFESAADMAKAHHPQFRDDVPEWPEKPSVVFGKPIRVLCYNELTALAKKED